MDNKRIYFINSLPTASVNVGCFYVEKLRWTSYDEFSSSDAVW